MKRYITTGVTVATFFTLEGCGAPAKKFEEKKLVIPSKQTVRISEIDLSITNNGCGRQWVVDEGKTGTERPYCDLEINLGDSMIHAGGDFKPVSIGNIQITIEKMNPWGREDDSVPPGGCRVWVKRTGGR